MTCSIVDRDGENQCPCPCGRDYRPNRKAVEKGTGMFLGIVKLR